MNTYNNKAGTEHTTNRCVNPLVIAAGRWRVVAVGRQSEDGLHILQDLTFESGNK